MSIIDAAFNRSRVVMLIFIMLLIAGTVSYIEIPKEAEPDIPIPTFYVSMTHEGISPDDAERLLIRPMEKELQSLEGLKEITAVADEGYASVILEFNAGFDQDQALLDIREKVDLARSELPPDTNEPRVTEVNVALFPVLSIGLSGRVPERELVNIARDLQDKIEALPGVLEAEIGGDREEMMEVVIDNAVMESYDITFQDVAAVMQNNNRLIAAGALDSGAGRLVLKVPGVIEDVGDVMNLPVKTIGTTVVQLKDLVDVRRSFKDPEGFARLGGENALVLEVKKRLGANIIQTIEDIRTLVSKEQQNWPHGVNITFMQDKSENIKDMLSDLQNNVLSAIVLVMIVIIAVLGVRPGFLVGMAIPGSFLAGILIIYLAGFTINIVVLFSLILVTGMLVDGAIVTIELADRKIAEGMERAKAYAFAAKRMSWPIIASTATTLVVFFPLLFWPGLVGEFMKYMPITVLFTLMASLFMALIFIPVLGGLIGNKSVTDTSSIDAIRAAENGDLDKIKGLTGQYLKTLNALLYRPGIVLIAAIIILISTGFAFGKFGRGVEFFPDIEPDFIQIQVQARGDLSVYEKDKIVQNVEQHILDMDVFKAVYSRTLGNTNNQQGMPADVIGVIQLEFINWRLRPKATEIIEDVRVRIKDIPGIKAQVRKAENGPSAGKPVEVEIRGNSSEKLTQAIQKMRGLMDEIGGFVDIEDNRPLPGLEWRMEIDRANAARAGADVTVLGSAIQLLTTGLKVGEYQPDDATEELDIRLRFPANERSLENLTQLRVPTPIGHIPIDNFVRFDTAQKTGTINRTSGQRVMTVKSDVEENLLPDQQTSKLKEAVANANFDPAVTVIFKGQDEDQQEAGAFLMKAFAIAIFLMTTILLAQFNNIYQSILVLSAIIFSTAGILIGLLITGNPFGIVMCGIGVIALAGIVVNNNIVLIDTYNDLRHREKLEPREAIMRTAAQRMRPVLLTSITTVLGLLPMVFSMNINFLEADIAFGAPSTQWWVQLSSSIAGGLSFATVLTLILTPCMLMLGENFALPNWMKRKKTPVKPETSTTTKRTPKKTTGKAIKTSLLIAACVGLSSCASMQNFNFNKTQLDIPIPHSWISLTPAEGAYQNAGWVDNFDDPILTALVFEALTTNYDLEAAASNFEIARAQSTRTNASAFPTLDFTLGANKRKTLQSAGTSGTADFRSGAFNQTQYNASFDASWELDVWGRIAATGKAAEYDYYAAGYDYAAARQSLAAQTAKTYFAVIESEKQLRLSYDFEDNMSETLKVTQAYFNEGLIGAQEIYLVEADLARASESVQNARSANALAKRNLELLLGRYPSAQITTQTEFPRVPYEVRAGIPAEILERRPDILAAERRVASAFNHLDAAKAAKLPSIALTGTLGSSTSELRDILDPASMFWNVAGNLLFPIFNAGALNADIDIRNAEQAAAIANYKQTALNAFGEVETALTNELNYKMRQQNIDDASASAQTAEHIAEQNFKAGEIELFDLLQIKRSTITAQTARVRAHRELLDQRVNLYMGLGGDIYD